MSKQSSSKHAASQLQLQPQFPQQQYPLTAEQYQYQTEIQQMMYVFGDVQDPLPETTMLVEDIVRSHMLEICADAALRAQDRGNKSLHPEDIIFLIRKDRKMVNRVKLYLSWKDVRKAEKDDGVDVAEMDLEQMMDDVDHDDGSENKTKVKQKRFKVPWDITMFYGNVIEDLEEEEEDEEQVETFKDQMQRLKAVDEITRNMTKEDYMHYTDCRQASFCFKKPSKFIAWCNIRNFSDGKPGTDAVEVLGFLGYEIVQKLTEISLQVKKEWEEKAKKEQRHSMNQAFYVANNPDYLFGYSGETKTPIQPGHVMEAYRRLQSVGGFFIQEFDGSKPDLKMRLV